jgi:DNA-binding MarR family transcriptional regulator
VKETAEARPLFALVSQILVAFTLEIDNAFEKMMKDTGYPGAGLSWSVWSQVMQFVGDGISLKELQERSASRDVHFMVGCLERWRFIVLGRSARRVVHKRTGREMRDGWGSGRGIRDEWIVRPAQKARKAAEIWPGLFGEIEEKWKARFGKEEIARLRKSLGAMAEKLDWRRDALDDVEERLQFPSRLASDSPERSLAILLASVLYAFAMEFRAEAGTPLSWCANTIRVLGEKPIRAGEIARRTGASKEMVAIGWRLKKFVVEERDPEAKRGTVVRLNEAGLAVKAKHARLVREIEQQWEEKFGKVTVRELRERLEGLFAARDGRLLAEGLAAPKGVARSGVQVPALGRKEVAAAAKQRVKDMAEQTEWFVRDPQGALPWFPLWDMNRGFGV